MAGIPSPFDWKSLITPAAALGAKALGDAIVPDASVQNARTNAQTAQVRNDIAKQRMANANEVRSIAMPGMMTQLGYSPQAGKQLAGGYSLGASNPTPDFSGVSTNGSTGGSKAGRVALGAGLTAAPFVPGIIGHAANAATGATATGLGGLGHVGSMLGAAAPVLLPAAAVLAGALIWKHTQAHPIADKWVQGAQNPFDANWQKIQSAAQSGQISPQQAQQSEHLSAQNYLNALKDFASQGNRNMEVAKNAAATFRKSYGDPSQYGVQLPF